MRIRQIILRHMEMEMKFAFTNSSATVQTKNFILIEAQDEDGLSGWGESVAFTEPFYTEETFKTNWHVIEDFLIPMLKGKELHHPDELVPLFASVKRNKMAKAAIEGAIWDLYAKRAGIPLYKALGGERTAVEAGISIGVQPTIDELLSVIKQHVDEGYKRVKVKIKPGWDEEILKEIRRAFPSLPLMADANSAYRLEDLSLLKRLDEYGLMMIEQPLASDDIIDHAIIQQELDTPVCLDESITSYEDARKALQLGSCRVINVKIGRVGGLTEAKRIHDLCREKHIPVWCGGMLEAGVGRAHNIALSTLSQFTLPGDNAASSRYWVKDIIKPEVTVESGMIDVPERPGIGYEIDEEAVESFTMMKRAYNL
ncbi:o-succinylbenzoate synthase [Bacillus thermotolerans]|uniref:o-succinylbenzoate synthase n=1 Tax=Bacillus thermotolerans TaxID=1221996 RepID=A0A0F5I5A4_BACTR|nr:o-succinylbenzoate synthase [Bacillus thermotolerans]KKB39911.1 O-succinylbenzoate synthase [Bacillus thermotolerans]KKB40839.1 O-succinylbenzoate synthase [Bacillus thermotolerans]